MDELVGASLMWQQALLIMASADNMIEHAQQPAGSRVRNGHRRIGPIMAGEDQMLGGKQRHRRAGEQRPVDGD